MRESQSGRNLPLAVSMTTSLSSIPAAARAPHPLGRFQSVSVSVFGLSLINVPFLLNLTELLF